jgi:hypothetical protein
VALLEHLAAEKLDPDAINYVALRAYPAATGQRVNSSDTSRQSGVVPVKGAHIPVLSTFADPASPAPAKRVTTRRCRGRARRGLSPARHFGGSRAERRLAD